MERTIGNIMKMSGLALSMVAGCMTFAAPAQACSAPQRPAVGAAFTPKMAAVAKLGLMRPKTAEERGPEARDVFVAGLPSIVGLWQVNYLVGGQVVDAGFEAWHEDGTEILVDTAAPATDNVCIGTYVQTGPLTFRLTHPSWTFDMDGNLTGTAMIRNTVTLDLAGNKFTGTFSVDIFDINGTHVDRLEGQLAATRIKAN